MQSPIASMRPGVADSDRGAFARVRRWCFVLLPVWSLAAATIACALPCAAAASTPRPRARAALSQTYVKEEAHLHLSGKGGGSAIAEQGTGSGTFEASIQIDIAIKISKVTGSFNAYLKGGSISGYASATPHFSGKYVSFKGSLTINHGTGKYSGASGTASLYGAIDRSNYSLAVQVVGHLRL
jgi:hypothetical protein